MWHKQKIIITQPNQRKPSLVPERHQPSSLERFGHLIRMESGPSQLTASPIGYENTNRCRSSTCNNQPAGVNCFMKLSIIVLLFTLKVDAMMLRGCFFRKCLWLAQNILSVSKNIILRLCQKIWLSLSLSTLDLNVFSSLALRYQPSFHGVDLSALRGAAVDEYFRQPIVVCGTHTVYTDFNTF